MALLSTAHLIIIAAGLAAAVKRVKDKINDRVEGGLSGMKKGISPRPARSAVIVILVLAFAGTALSLGVKKRVRFLRGSNSTTISGAVVRGQRDRYIVGAREGQTMSVRVKSPEDNAVFQIYFAGEQESLEGAGEGDDATRWSGKLITTTDYVIVVGASRGNASYKLEVKIE
jgi:hypothetical protein